MKKLLFVFVLCLTFSSWSREIIVTSTNDTGAGTLRQAIGTAVAEDTIIIDVKGEIVLDSPIAFPDDDITIIGPYAKHNNVIGGAGNTVLFQINTKSNIKFIGLGFNGNSADVTVAMVTTSTNITFESCVIEDIVSSSNGVLIFDNSSFNILNCSFIGNAAAESGAIYVESTNGESTIVNSTFYNNTSSLDGGALTFNAGCDVDLRNNIFKENNATNSGDAIQSIATNIIALNNNVFEGLGGGGVNQLTGLGYLDGGGNVMVENYTGEFLLFSGTSNVETNGTDLILSVLLEDGYGLKYFRILSAASPLVNSGLTLSGAPLFDCRRVGRTLSPTATGSAPLVDAGPFEFTPFTLTAQSGTALESVITLVNSSSNGDPVKYVDFNITGYNPLTEFIITSTLSLAQSVVIDGYSQTGTTISGPALNGVAGVTPASNLINITCSAYSVDEGFLLGNSVSNCMIAGLAIYGFNNIGINSYSGTDNISLFGNHVGFYFDGTNFIVSENKSNGLYLQGNNYTIGGDQHFQRNVISGNGQTAASGLKANIGIAGGASSGNNITIIGNIIGLQPDGVSSFGLTGTVSAGIKKTSTSTGPINDLIIGSQKHLSRNVISGNQGKGITLAEIGTGCKINNNYIGLAYDGTTEFGNMHDGIILSSCTNSVQIGVTKGNVISGNANSGVSLGSSSLAIIVNNLIGTDSSGSVAIGNFYGISISGTSNNNQIGIDTLNGNVVSGNTSHGVQLINGSGNSVQGNKIGTNKLGTAALANGHNGVFSQDATTSLIGGTQLTRNILSGNGIAGVGLINGGSTTIAANFIGTDVTGQIAIPNDNGVRVAGTHSAYIGAAYPNHNVISGNILNGIITESENVQIEGNLIGLNKNQNSILANLNDGIQVNANNVIIGASNINIVSGNSKNGINLNNVTGCDVDSCLIGTNTLFATGLGNGENGIQITGGSDNDIGAISGNTIVGHLGAGFAGVRIDAASDNWLLNNMIGITLAGTVIPNTRGIHLINGSSNNVVGEILASNKNIISGNIECGVQVESATTTNNKIQGNYIGLSIDGNTAVPNQYGIEIHNLSDDNEIGANADISKRNVISGNTIAGIYIHGSGITENKIYSNNLGTTADFASPLPNDIAVWIVDCDMVNYIGLDNDALNSPVIAGNNNGVVISNSSNQVIYNCKIGTSANGLTAQSNTNGIVIQNGSSDNIIGGVGLKGNLISGNTNVGIAINSSNATLVLGNKIGTNTNGDVPISNLVGIYISGGDGNLIGRPTIGEGNLISGNSAIGVSLENNPINTLVQNNKIGTDLTGNSVYLGSANGAGVSIKNTTSNSNLIGGNGSVNEGNLFADNGVSIYLENCSSQGVYGNVIGIKADGSAYLGNNNANVGVYLKGGNNNRIGEPGNNRNFIANQAINVFVDNETNTDILGNYIGNNLTGDGILTGAVATGVGIRVDSASLNTRILENVLSGLSNGVEIRGAGTNDNKVQGNKIGTDFTGNVLLGNSFYGILLDQNSALSIIGGKVSDVAERNVICGNSETGLSIQESGDNIVSGNYFGAAMDGVNSLQSSRAIFIHNPNSGNLVTGNRIGGAVADSANYIVDCTDNGLMVFEYSTEVYIVGNIIGELPNGSPSGMGYAGIAISGNTNNIKIGGVNPGEGNKIVNNGQNGVSIGNFPAGTAENISVIGNELHHNHLGIDIGGGAYDGFTLDNQSGLNNNIQMPLFLEAFKCNGVGNTKVGLSLRGLNIGGDYLIEFFDNTDLANGNVAGEADTLIYRYYHTALTSNDTVFIELSQTLGIGALISATMTDYNGDGSTSEISENYTVTDQPTAPNVTANNETCNGANDGAITISDPAARVYYFALDSDIPQFDLDNDTTFSVGPGVYTVTYKYLNGCQVTTSNQTIASGGTPTFNLVVSADTCGLSNGQIVMDASTNTVGDVGSESYENITTVSTLTTNTFSSLTDGTYDIVLHTDLGGVGCISDTVQAIVTAYAIPTSGMDFVFDDFCFTSGIGQVNTPPSYGGGTYTLTTNPSGASINSSTGEINGTITAGSEYTVDYVYGSCVSQQSPTAINELDATFTFDDYCVGTQSQISISNPTPESDAIFSLNPVPIDGAGINPLTGEILLPVGGTTYTVEYNSGGGCPGIHTEDVLVMALPPIPVIASTDTIVCDENQIPELYLVGTSDPIDWYTDQTQPAVQTNSITYTPVSLTSGDNYFYGKATGTNGCVSGFGTTTLIRPDLAIVTTSDDVEICLGSEVEIYGLGGVTYNWLVADDIDGKDSESIVVSPTSETFYVIEITDENDCVVSDSVKVSILDPSLCNITIYTAFSPNGDGDNDVWVIDGIEGYSENFVYFYNRWGDLINVIENYDNNENAWDGTNKFTGNQVTAGTYFYIVESNGIKAQSSWVQVVR